jgi:hypothetical protein
MMNDEEKQESESRIQKPEEKKNRICESGLPPYHSEFWILTPDSWLLLFSSSFIIHHSSFGISDAFSINFTPSRFAKPSAPQRITTL